METALRDLSRANGSSNAAEASARTLRVGEARSGSASTAAASGVCEWPATQSATAITHEPSTAHCDVKQRSAFTARGPVSVTAPTDTPTPGPRPIHHHTDPGAAKRRPMIARRSGVPGTRRGGPVAVGPVRPGRSLAGLAANESLVVDAVRSAHPADLGEPLDEVVKGAHSRRSPTATQPSAAAASSMVSTGEAFTAGLCRCGVLIPITICGLDDLAKPQLNGHIQRRPSAAGRPPAESTRRQEARSRRKRRPRPGPPAHGMTSDALTPACRHRLGAPVAPHWPRGGHGWILCGPAQNLWAPEIRPWLLTWRDAGRC